MESFIFQCTFKNGGPTQLTENLPLNVLLCSRHPYPYNPKKYLTISDTTPFSINTRLDVVFVSFGCFWRKAKYYRNEFEYSNTSWIQYVHQLSIWATIYHCYPQYPIRMYRVLFGSYQKNPQYWIWNLMNSVWNFKREIKIPQIKSSWKKRLFRIPKMSEMKINIICIKHEWIHFSIDKY